MEGDRPQFDVLLGGREELPQDFSLVDFASARAQEIIAISEALQEPRRTGLVFQRLPRHMRRRIMSHNAKRMPRQLREAHQRQMEKGGLPPKSKRPSRKYRRRPSHLLEAYNRRQKENVWLETHVWHAKRFHMISKWGYKLPHFPNDKSSRACYRGSANHCLLQDVSYLVCIELMGSFESIVNGLSSLTRQECGLSFQAKLWRSGDREGSVMLFHSDSKYPLGAIGRVSFLWKPEGGPEGSERRSEGLIVAKEDASGACGGDKNGNYSKRMMEAMDTNEDSNQERKLWMWVHPSFYAEVKEELIKVFRFEQHPPPQLPVEKIGPPSAKLCKSETPKTARSTESKITGDIRENVSIPVIACDNVTRFFGRSNVEMTVLKDMLVRLRLTGPLSHAVLREALAVAPEMTLGRDAHPCWQPWENVFRCQRDLWEELSSITSPANISPCTVLGLTILDPRGNLPLKRTKAVDSDPVDKIDVIQATQSLPHSPLWEPQVRDLVTRSKPADSQMNQRRSGNLVPGVTEMGDTSSTLADDESPRLPILLIQRPGSQDPSSRRLGYGSGWDVITTAGWGKPLWIAMVMRGARAAGLRDAEAVGDIAVSRMCSWPSPPDTRAGQIESELLEQEAKQNYFKLPPSKRPNYIKLGISSPFSCPWNILCREWSSISIDSSTISPSSDTFYVLRNSLKLELISNALRGSRKPKPWGKKMQGASSHHSSDGQKSSSSSSVSLCSGGDLLQTINDPRCLVPVKVTICRKGVVSNHALICIPREGDILSGSECQRGPEEPSNPDLYKEKRAKVRKEHKERLRELRRKRLKLRREKDAEVVGGASGGGTQKKRQQPLMGPEATADICAVHRKRMERLFLPTVVHVRNSCAREVAGYLTSGGFSFPEARETGYGYITLPAVDGLIQTEIWNKNLLVFVRNTSSSHYFPAEIEVVTN